MTPQELKESTRAAALIRGAAQGNLLAWARWLDPTYLWPAHIRHLAEALHKLESGSTTRLVVEMPPRFGKSELCSKLFPSWYLGRNPHHRLILASHTASLAKTHSRHIRNALYEHGEQVFGVGVATDSAAVDKWDLASPHKGGAIAVGVGGTATGFGADCFPAGTMIATESGYIDIATLTLLTSPPKILSYNHERGECEYKAIRASRKKVGRGLVRVSTRGGREVLCTPEHLIWTEDSGYREANLLLRGQRAVVESKQEKQGVCFLREEQRKLEASGLQEVLFPYQKSHNNTPLQRMWLAIREKTIRIREVIKKWCRESFLFGSVQEAVAIGPLQEKMHWLWRSGGQEDKKILRRGLQGEGKSQEQGGLGIRGEELSGMLSGFCPKDKEAGSLWPGVCGQGSCKEHEGRRESSLHRWEMLLERVQGHVPAHQGEGWVGVCGMRRETGSPCLREGRGGGDEVTPNSPPHKREDNGQCPRKPGEHVLDVPHCAPQVEEDPISLVERVSTEPHEVYDIEIEGNNNFFANGILVHNCLIIDDPLKSAEEAHSALQRDKIWEWYQSVARTRLHPGGKIIIIATRWHLEDLTGHVLAGNEPWERVCFPALAEEDDALGRKPGESLWPERYSTADLERLQDELGDYVWNALYQQRPYNVSGGIFKSDTLSNRFEIEDRFMRTCTNWLSSWDLSFKETKTGSYVVGQVWCRKGANLYLCDQVRARMDFTDTLKAMVAMCAKWPQVNTHLVEEKANGAAILSALKGKISGMVAVKPTGSKEARAHAVAPFFEGGNVHLPRGAGWVDDYVSEFLAFPRGMHDDQVDATSQALHRMQRHMRSSSPVEWELDVTPAQGGTAWSL